MEVGITTLFDDFFKYQPIDLQGIADSCKKCGLDTYVKTAAAIAAYFHQYELQDDIKANAEIIGQNLIQLEFIKALTYQICLINDTVR